MKLRFERHPSAPHDMRVSCLDDDTYDGAPDAGRQCVGWGPTNDEAEADFNRLRQEMIEEEEGPLHKPWSPI